MTIEAFISVLEDELVATAALVTAGVAMCGLSTWRRELKGKAEFEVARKLALSTYKLRDRLSDFRSPLVSGQEFPSSYKGLGVSKSPQEEVDGWVVVFRNRWQPVFAAVQEFETWALEAEAIWGNEFREITLRLTRCVSELRAAIDAILSDKASGGEDFRVDRDFAKEIRSKVFSTHGTKNPMTNEIMAAITGIEEQIRPHLGRK